MSALETLDQFQAQAETELRALESKCDRQAQEAKDLRKEVYTLHGTLNETVKAAHRYAAECRSKAAEAKQSEIAMRASLVCACDELERTGAWFGEQVGSLKALADVLEADGYEMSGVNPLRFVQTLRAEMLGKVEKLKKFGGSMP